MLKMIKKTILLIVAFVGLLSCQRKLHPEYTSAYKKKLYYFAGTNISFFQDSTFKRNDWTDQLLYGQVGKGRFRRDRKHVILHYSGYEQEILQHKQSTKEQNKIFIKSINKPTCFPIEIQVLDLNNNVSMFHELTLLNTKWEVIQTYFTDLDGKITIHYDNLETKFVLRSKELQSEPLNFEFDNTMRLDTTIKLANHLPYIETGRIDTFDIKPFGTFIEQVPLRFEKLRKTKPSSTPN